MFLVAAPKVAKTAPAVSPRPEGGTSEQKAPRVEFMKRAFKKGGKEKDKHEEEDPPGDAVDGIHFLTFNE